MKAYTRTMFDFAVTVEYSNGSEVIDTTERTAAKAIIQAMTIIERKQKLRGCYNEVVSIKVKQTC